PRTASGGRHQNNTQSRSHFTITFITCVTIVTNIIVHNHRDPIDRVPRVDGRRDARKSPFKLHRDRYKIISGKYMPYKEEQWNKIDNYGYSLPPTPRAKLRKRVVHTSRSIIGKIIYLLLNIIGL